jgi:hypothetical protein
MDALRDLARTSLAVFMNLGRPRLNEVSYVRPDLPEPEYAS